VSDPLEPDEAKASLSKADTAFREQRYDEAGPLYGALYRDEKLPKNRHELWAYCRRYAVVQRINAGPKTKAEWQEIREEIQRIQKFSPKPHWYDQYLLEFVQENSQRVSGAKRDGATVRGASPDEAANATPRPGSTPRLPKAPTARDSRSNPNASGSEPLFLPQETSLRSSEEPLPISMRDRGTLLR
jgi:hypothetical protein